MHVPEQRSPQVRLREIREMCERWCSKPEPERDPEKPWWGATLPASPDDIFWLLAHIDLLDGGMERQKRHLDLVYGELSKALGPHAPKAWDRIKGALDA